MEQYIKKLKKTIEKKYGVQLNHHKKIEQGHLFFDHHIYLWIAPKDEDILETAQGYITHVELLWEAKKRLSLQQLASLPREAQKTFEVLKHCTVKPSIEILEHGDVPDSDLHYLVLMDDLSVLSSQPK